MCPFPKSRHGFTMLPLILFMFVIVGLISAGYMMLGPKVQLGKTVETTKSLDSIANAVILWTASSRSLPTTLQTVFTGGNPLDPWGSNILYVFDNNLTNTATGGICGKTSTNLTANGTVNTAFVLISSAGDALQSVWSGAPALALATTAYPTAGATTATLVTGDLFKIVTLEELKNRAGCYGSTQGRLKILNNELPKVASGIDVGTQLKVFADGGVTTAYDWNPLPSLTGLMFTSTVNTVSITGIAPTCPGVLCPSSCNLVGGNYSCPLTFTVASGGATVSKTLNLIILPNPLPTPTAAWNFNEGSGNTIGSGSTLGTIAGTANWVPRAGGFSLYLDGTNNYIYFNDINYFNIGTGNVALAAWVNFSGMPKQSWCDPVSKVDMAIGAIVGKGFLYPAIGYGMYVTQTRQCTSCTSGCGAWSNYKVAFQLRNPANTDIHYVTSDDTINGGTWTFVTAMLDRSALPATDQIKLYLNGVKQTVATNDYQYTAPTALNFDNSFKFTIGARHGGGSSYAFPYWGPIDDVQFYKVALSDGQVQTLYTTTALPYRIWNNSGVPRWYTYYDGTITTPCSTAPVASLAEFPPLSVKGTLSTYSNSTCTNNLFAVSYVNAIDTNGDNCLNINQTDRSCP